MRSQYNKKQFEDGKEMYIYLNGFIRDRSGDCSLSICNTLEEAMKDDGYGGSRAAQPLSPLIPVYTLNTRDTAWWT